jgi:hypothetical protein
LITIQLTPIASSQRRAGESSKTEGLDGHERELDVDEIGVGVVEPIRDKASVHQSSKPSGSKMDGQMPGEKNEKKERRDLARLVVSDGGKPS